MQQQQQQQVYTGEDIGGQVIQALRANQNPANVANYYIHPFMGHVVTDQAGWVSSTPEILRSEYDDMVSRQLGLSKEIVKNNRVLRGLTTPGAFLLEKNQDLVEIGKKCSDVYREILGIYSNKGYGDEEAKKHALEAARNRKKDLMDIHEMKFPTDVSKRSIGRLEGANAIGNLN